MTAENFISINFQRSSYFYEYIEFGGKQKTGKDIIFPIYQLYLFTIFEFHRVCCIPVFSRVFLRVYSQHPAEIYPRY